MKKLLIGLMICLGAFALPQQAKAQVNVSFQVFYDQLSPYGMWINNPTYGYVWVPTVSAGFQPYATDGYWTYTEWGWTWVSYYDWGWAPFHYGRWYYDPFYGYSWIPGNSWGPAWVSWRHCNGYYGWAPLGPGISYGASYATYNPPADRWIFVRERDFGRTNINNYYLDKVTNVTIIKNSTVINNTIVNKSRNETYIAGPARAEVQKYTGRDIKPVQVQDNNKPGRPQVNNNQLSVYRPKVSDGGNRAAPAKVYSANEAKPIIEKRNAGTPVTPSTGNRSNQAMPAGSAKPSTSPRKINNDQPVRTMPNRNDVPQRGNEQPRMREQQPQRVNPNTAPRNVEQQRTREPVPQRTAPPQRIEQQRQIDRAPQRMEQPRQIEQPRQMERAPQPIQQPRMNQAPPQPQRMSPPPSNPGPRPGASPGGGRRGPG